MLLFSYYLGEIKDPSGDFNIYPLHFTSVLSCFFNGKIDPTNLFLDEFDEAMIISGFQLVRYSDDFIVLSKTCDDAEKALELTETKLEQLRLSLDKEDTHITDFEEGFKFLGVTFLNDSAFVPFDRIKRERKVLYMPPPFDLAGYLSHREEKLGKKL